jgi:outer membrane protein TolC
MNSTLSHLQMAQNKYDVGTARKSDVLQWQVKKQQDETALTEIDNNISELTGYWKNLLGSNADDLPAEIKVENYDQEIAEFSNLKNAEIEAEVSDFLNDVQQTSPVINTLDLAKKMMRKNYTLAKGNFLPSLNLQYSYQIESDDKFNFDGDDNWSLAAVLSVPIFQSGASYTNLKKAKFELKKTEYETDCATENYLVSAENNFRKLITKAKVVEDNKTALEFARENHQIINDLYLQGLVTNTELLDAEAMLYGSEMNLVASYYDFIFAKYEIKKYINKAGK